MLTYFYTKEKDMLYVYDDETGFYKLFNDIKGKWITPIVSFMQIDHDFDDLAPIPEAVAKEMSKGISFDEQLQEYLKLIGRTGDKKAKR